MRGTDKTSGSLFSYVDLEERIPAVHPLRKIRQRGGPGFSTSFMPRSALAWFSYHAASFVFGFRLA
jgi:hypothetical protein